MNRWQAIFCIVMATCVEPSNSGNPIPETKILCADSWYRSIEEIVPTGNGQGHGPDIGSDEWKSVIEFKFGIRDKRNLPSHDSETWHTLIVHQIVRKKNASLKNDRDPAGDIIATCSSYG